VVIFLISVKSLCAGYSQNQESRILYPSWNWKTVLVKRKARMGRNPATGEAIKIPAKTVVKRRVAKAAKETIVPGRKQES
jgi:hypothetical protein